MLEQWHDVVGYEGIYQVSNRGNVKRIAKAAGARIGRILKPNPCDTGCLNVSLSYQGKVRTYKIHHLVCKAFIGPAPTPSHEVNHKNGDRTDNRVSNLEWVTRSENILHAYRVLGRITSKGFHINVGESNGSAKLTGKQVREIRFLYSQRKANGQRRYTQTELSSLFMVSRRMVGKIVHYKAWTHI